VSPAHLGRRMKGSRGRIVVAEIRRARLTHACLLLETGNLPLGPIARDTGFGCRRSLERAFRGDLGTSPIAWRERHGRPTRPADHRVHITFHGPGEAGGQAWS